MISLNFAALIPLPYLHSLLPMIIFEADEKIIADLMTRLFYGMIHLSVGYFSESFETRRKAIMISLFFVGY